MKKKELKMGEMKKEEIKNKEIKYEEFKNKWIFHRNLQQGNWREGNLKEKCQTGIKIKFK